MGKDIPRFEYGNQYLISINSLSDIMDCALFRPISAVPMVLGSVRYRFIKVFRLGAYLCDQLII
jgi:hypothetical protein